MEIFIYSVHMAETNEKRKKYMNNKQKRRHQSTRRLNIRDMYDMFQA